ncbi:MAG: hypothetical protein IJ772_04960 [Bacilli bacterium]|nr:hypothetical protein [Bacilli bacterium]
MSKKKKSNGSYSSRLPDEIRREGERLEKQKVDIIKKLGTRCKDMKLTIKILSSRNEKLEEDNKYLRKYNRTLKTIWDEYKNSDIRKLNNEIKLLNIENKNLKARLKYYETNEFSFFQKLKILFFS